MPITITTAPDGLTVAIGGIEESFLASPSGNGVELTAAEAERLSSTLLRFAGEAERHDQNAPLPEPIVFPAVAADGGVLAPFEGRIATAEAPVEPPVTEATPEPPAEKPAAEPES